MSATALNRDHPLPALGATRSRPSSSYRQRRIRGRPVSPTDLNLTIDYEVSRHTVREAIRQLNKTGILKRERGRGTVINRSEFEQPLGTLYSLFQSIEATGTDQTSEVLQLEIITDSIAASYLELDEETEFVLLARLRRAGGDPLAVDRAWVPLNHGAPLLDVDWSHTAPLHRDESHRRAHAPRPVGSA